MAGGRECWFFLDEKEADRVLERPLNCSFRLTFAFVLDLKSDFSAAAAAADTGGSLDCSCHWWLTEMFQASVQLDRRLVPVISRIREGGAHAVAE